MEAFDLTTPLSKSEILKHIKDLPVDRKIEFKIKPEPGKVTIENTGPNRS